MKKEEMIAYAKEKGYEVRYGTYMYNDNVPYVEINGAVLYLAKRNPGGLSTTPNYSKSRFDALEYFCKAYLDEDIEIRKDFCEKRFFDLCRYDRERIVEINNRTYPYFEEEKKLWAELDNYDVVSESDYSQEDVEQFWKLRKSIISKNGMKWRKL